MFTIEINEVAVVKVTEEQLLPVLCLAGHTSDGDEMVYQVHHHHPYESKMVSPQQIVNKIKEAGSAGGYVKDIFIYVTSIYCN